MLTIMLGVLLLRATCLIDSIDQPVQLRGLHFRTIFWGSKIEIIILLVNIFHVNIIVHITDELFGEKLLIKVLCFGA